MLTIGQMSEIYRVSTETLRHYEKIGLLRPGGIDKANGYRYYGDSQISTMLSIGQLKRYGFPLTNTQGLLDVKGARSPLGQLRKQKFRLERQISYLSATVREMRARLEGFEGTGDIMSYRNNYETQVRETEEQVLVTSRQNMSVEEFGDYYGELYEKIVGEHLTANGITMAIYRDQELDPAYSGIELTVGITGRDKADYIMPKRFCAATVHKGAYSGLPDAYDAIVSWANTSEYQSDGIPYEVYVRNHFHSLPPEEWGTEVFFPVKK